jgi:hypothetical protein
MPYKPEMVRVQGPGGITVTKRVMAQTEPSQQVTLFQISFEMRFHGLDVPFHQALLREETSLIRATVTRVISAMRSAPDIWNYVSATTDLGDLLERARGADFRETLGCLYTIPDWFGNGSQWPWSVKKGLYSDKFSSIIREAPPPAGHSRYRHFNISSTGL